MDELGYFIEQGVLGVDECSAILDSVNLTSSDDRRGGVRHLMSNQIVRKFANDDKLLGLAQRWLGRPAIPFKATFFNKTGKANWLVAWHQDTVLPLADWTDDLEWGPWSSKAGIRFAQAPDWALFRLVALRIQLDDSDMTNGPLRLIERSHLKGILSADEILQTVKNGRQVTCLTQKGGVIAMSPLIVHASSKAILDKPRRVLHIEYADSLDMSPKIRLAIA